MGTTRTKPLTMGRAGFTLVELIIVVLIMGILAGVAVPKYASALQNMRIDSAAKRIKSDFGLARQKAIANSTTQTVEFSTAVTVVVPDRLDPDTSPETIRYAWSGTAGDPLTRQYNGGTVASFLESVDDFGIVYYQPAAKIEYVTLWIQATSSSITRVETSVPLMNQP